MLMRVFSLILFTLGLLAGCSRLPVPAAPEFQSHAVVQVPLQLIHTSDLGVLPLIPLQLGERQSWWLIDTGSSHNLVSLRLVQLLQLKAAASSEVATIGGRQSATYYRLPDMRIGNLQLSRQSATALDLSVLSGSDGLMVDGILGVPALQKLAVTLDYAGGRASFAAGSSSRFAHSILPFRLQAGVPVARLAVLDGRPGDFILDTGNADSLVIVPAYTGAQYGMRSGDRFIPVEDLGGSVPTRLALLPGLQLGQLSLQQVPVSLPIKSRGLAGVAGSLGNGVFARQVVTFDFPQQRLLLGGAGGQLGMPGSLGFLLAAGNQIEVVLADSPAERQGIHAGDQIVAVNGRDTRTASSHIIWQLLQARSEASLTLVRGGQAWNVSLVRAHFLPPLIR